jgi:AcrR family transcriptional regulator
MPGPREVRRNPSKGADSRERVLQIAAKVLAERGYAGTTIRVVAKRSGLEAASLYYHFSSKDELVECVLSHGLVELAGKLRAAVSSLPAAATSREAFLVATNVHLQYLVSNGDYALASRRVLNQVHPDVRRKLVVLRDDIDRFWRDLLETARQRSELHAAVDLSLLRSFVLGALNSVLEWYRPGRKSIDEISEQFALIITEAVFR